MTVVDWIICLRVGVQWTRWWAMEFHKAREIHWVSKQIPPLSRRTYKCKEVWKMRTWRRQKDCIQVEQELSLLISLISCSEGSQAVPIRPSGRRMLDRGGNSNREKVWSLKERMWFWVPSHMIGINFHIAYKGLHYSQIFIWLWEGYIRPKFLCYR
jgi:hypothetical protein